MARQARIARSRFDPQFREVVGQHNPTFETNSLSAGAAFFFFKLEFCPGTPRLRAIFRTPWLLSTNYLLGYSRQAAGWDGIACTVGDSLRLGLPGIFCLRLKIVLRTIPCLCQKLNSPLPRASLASVGCCRPLFLQMNMNNTRAQVMVKAHVWFVGTGSHLLASTTTLKTYRGLYP